MKENENLRETYNKIAKDWNKDHSGDDWWLKGADDFLTLFPKEAIILDVGCGGGYKTKYIKEKGYKNVAGVDFSEGMIDDAKGRYPDIDFDVLDIYDFDRYPKMIDGIFCQAVLLHIPKKRIMEVLEKLKSKLNKDGLLYVAVKSMKDNGIEEEIKIENDYGYDYERFFSYFTIEEVKDYFKNIGFEIVSESIVDSGSGRSKWINVMGRKSN